MLLSTSFVNTLLFFGNLGLVAVFALAAVAKLRDPDRARDGLIGFGVPERWARSAHIALVAVELLITALLAYPPSQRAGALGALGALTLFSLSIGWQLLHGRRPACACFGALTPASISWKSLGRNVVLMIVATTLIAFPINIAPTPFATTSWPVLVAVAWGGISTLWLLLLTRQNGRLLLRIEQLEQRAEGTVVPVAPTVPLRTGDLVPPLRLSDARGQSLDLRNVRGQPTLVLFLDAGCHHCQSVVALISEHLIRTAALVVISEDAALQHNLPVEITLLVDPGRTAAAQFGVRGTPAAVLVDADGALAQLPLHGAPAVRAALDQITLQEVRREWAPV